MQEKYGFSELKARAAIHNHIRLCFDVCYVAVAFEEPQEVVDRLGTVGIKVGEIQLSGEGGFAAEFSEKAGRTLLV